MKKQNRKRLANRVLAALCFAMALVLLLSAFGATLAKYVRQDSANGAAVPVPFYFTSDKLTEASPYYHISEPTGDDPVEITFSLSNFVDELRCTEGTLQYSYWARSAEGSQIAGAEGSGELSGSFQTKNVTVSLKKSDFGADGAVTITAQCTAPYTRSISARFGFTAEDVPVQWEVSEQDGAVVLELFGGSGLPVTVTGPDTLIPDPLNALLSGASPGSVTFTAEPGVRYALTFLKKDQQSSYTADDFTVTEG